MTWSELIVLSLPSHKKDNEVVSLKVILSSFISDFEKLITPVVGVVFSTRHNMSQTCHKNISQKKR